MIKVQKGKFHTEADQVGYQNRDNFPENIYFHFDNFGVLLGRDSKSYCYDL